MVGVSPSSPHGKVPGEDLQSLSIRVRSNLGGEKKIQSIDLLHLKQQAIARKDTHMAETIDRLYQTYQKTSSGKKGLHVHATHSEWTGKSKITELSDASGKLENKEDMAAFADDYVKVRAFAVDVLKTSPPKSRSIQNQLLHMTAASITEREEVIAARTDTALAKECCKDLRQSVEDLSESLDQARDEFSRLHSQYHHDLAEKESELKQAYEEIGDLKTRSLEEAADRSDLELRLLQAERKIASLEEEKKALIEKYEEEASLYHTEIHSLRSRLYTTTGELKDRESQLVLAEERVLMLGEENTSLRDLLGSLREEAKRKSQEITELRGQVAKGEEDRKEALKEKVRLALSLGIESDRLQKAQDMLSEQERALEEAQRELTETKESLSRLEGSVADLTAAGEAQGAQIASLEKLVEESIDSSEKISSELLGKVLDLGDRGIGLNPEYKEVYTALTRALDTPAIQRELMTLRREGAQGINVLWLALTKDPGDGRLGKAIFEAITPIEASKAPRITDEQFKALARTALMRKCLPHLLQAVRAEALDHLSLDAVLDRAGVRDLNARFTEGTVWGAGQREKAVDRSKDFIRYASSFARRSILRGESDQRELKRSIITDEIGMRAVIRQDLYTGSGVSSSYPAQQGYERSGYKLAVRPYGEVTEEEMNHAQAVARAIRNYIAETTTYGSEANFKSRDFPSRTTGFGAPTHFGSKLGVSADHCWQSLQMSSKIRQLLESALEQVDGMKVAPAATD